jgi:hypothetical protein
MRSKRLKPAGFALAACLLLPAVLAASGCQPTPALREIPPPVDARADAPIRGWGGFALHMGLTQAVAMLAERGYGMETPASEEACPADLPDGKAVLLPPGEGRRQILLAGWSGDVGVPPAACAVLLDFKPEGGREALRSITVILQDHPGFSAPRYFRTALIPRLDRRHQRIDPPLPDTLRWRDPRSGNTICLAEPEEARSRFIVIEAGRG